MAQINNNGYQIGNCVCSNISKHFYYSFINSHLQNLEQFNLELEGGTWRDGITAAAIAISQVGRNDQSGLSSFLHHGKSLLPSLDDSAQSKTDGLATFDRRIKDGPVSQGSMVVHLNLVRKGGTGSSTFLVSRRRNCSLHS